MTDLTIVILAAGQGKRMHSDLPKVLQPLAGRPLLAHVLDTAAALEPDTVKVVHGHGGDLVRAAFDGVPVEWVHQAEQLGTGHALKVATPGIPADHLVLVLCGDVPLVTAGTLRALIDAAADGVALLTVDLDRPTGYGRIVRDESGRVTHIIEERDANDEQRTIREINTGTMVLPASRLADWLERMSNDNRQGEYYLTDLIAMATADGVTVTALKADDPMEVAGVNDRAQHAAVERALQCRRAHALMAAGVTLMDPDRFDLRGTLSCGRDVVIDVNCVFIGDVELGDGTVIGPNCVIEDARIGRECRIGPFARIRPETVVGDRARVGNFVEVKKSTLGDGAKVNHLAYVGDAEVGADANVGAGTITCNYDGAAKHRTVIGDRAFIGSNTSLVAPVTIGDGATIGAGSVVTKDAPADKLTVARARQTTVEGWQRPGKKE